METKDNGIVWTDYELNYNYSVAEIICEFPNLKHLSINLIQITKGIGINGIEGLGQI